MSLRDLFIGVDFDVNEKELRKGDDAVNDLTKETKKAGSEMKTLDKNSKRAGSSIGSMAKKIGAIVGIYEIGRAFKFAGQEALNLIEETDKFNTVFGGVSDEARTWSDQYAKTIRDNKFATREAMADMQNLTVGFGATRVEAFEMSKSFTMLADDLAAMGNTSKEMARGNLQSVLVGQHQAGKKFGLGVTEATLALEAQRRGYKKNFADLQPLEKMQLRLDVATRNSADSIGKAASEANNLSGRLRGAKNWLAETSTVAGKQLLPSLEKILLAFDDNKESIENFIVGGVQLAVGAFETLVTAGGFLVDTFNTLSPIIYGVAAAFIFQKTSMMIVGVISGISAAYNALAVMQLYLGTTTRIGTALQWAWNAAFLANPVGAVLGAIAIAIGLVVGGVKLLYDHFDGFRKLWDKHIGPIWDSIQGFLGFGDGGDIDVNQNTRTTAGTVTTENKNTTVAGTVSTSVPKYAKGTNNAKAGLSIVGENGIEAVSMNGGEKVFNNKETENMLGGNSQTNNISVNVTVNGDSNGKQVATNVVDEIDNYFRRMKLKGGYA